MDTPYALSVDGDGRVYVALAGTFALRIFAPAANGAYTGQPSIHNPGYKDILRGVGTDAAGNIYVLDIRLNRVREYGRCPEGICETGGFHHDQPLIAASATGMAVSAEGDVFIADMLGVHHYAPSSAGFARLDDVTTLPSLRVALDAAGNVHVATVARSILRFDRSGNGYAVPQTVAVVDADDIAVDGAGDVYALDEAARSVHRYVRGNGYAAAALAVDAAQLQQPMSLAADAQGSVYVGDQSDHSVRKFVPTAAGYARVPDVVADPGKFVLPAGVAVDASGNVFLADQGPGVWGAVHKYALTARGYEWATYVVPFGHYTPWAVAVDGAGNVYVTEIYGQGVHKYAPQGDGYVLVADIASDSHFSGVAVDAAGIVYIADYDHAQIRRYAPAGDGYTRLADVVNGDTPGRWISQPNALALDSAGNVYYTDEYLGSVFKFAPSADGYVGLGGAQAYGATAVAVDNSGTVYVGGSEALFGISVAILDPDPIFSLALPTSLRFWQIRTPGLATDAQGRLYISDVEDKRLIQAVSTPNLNQHGLTGSWYNPATGGQGLELELYPDFGEPGKGLVFGGWFTYDSTAAGGQRWYALGGAVSSTDGAVDLGVYAGLGGNFSAAPEIPATQVGTATLAFKDCTTGTLTYRFEDDRTGSIPLTRLTANTTCATLGDNDNAPSNYLLSGSWFDARFGGQGLIIDANPSQKVFFAAWYTYAPNGQAIGGSQSERWYVLQAEFPPGAKTLPNVPIYTDSGGVFDDPTPPMPTQVGAASITFHTCSSATLDYAFTAGSNKGLAGTLELTRTGPEPAGCQL